MRKAIISIALCALLASPLAAQKASGWNGMTWSEKTEFMSGFAIGMVAWRAFEADHRYPSFSDYMSVIADPRMIEIMDKWYSMPEVADSHLFVALLQAANFLIEEKRASTPAK